MKIALVEDNELHQAQIRQEIQNYFDELNEVCELHVFDNGSDMLDHYYSVGGYDLLLLDIQLPGMDGVSVARQVRQKDDKVLIAFITSISDLSYMVLGTGFTTTQKSQQVAKCYCPPRQPPGVNGEYLQHYPDR